MPFETRWKAECNNGLNSHCPGLFVPGWYPKLEIAPSIPTGDFHHPQRTKGREDTSAPVPGRGAVLHPMGLLLTKTVPIMLPVLLSHWVQSLTLKSGNEPPPVQIRGLELATNPLLYQLRVSSAFFLTGPHSASSWWHAGILEWWIVAESFLSEEQQYFVSWV